MQKAETCIFLNFSLIFETFSWFYDATIVDIISCKNTEKTSINGSERTITKGTDGDGKSYVQNGKAKITSDTNEK